MTVMDDRRPGGAGSGSGDGNGPMVREAESDPSRYSYYVDDDFYARLRDEDRQWEDDWHPVDHDTHHEVERLLIREAYLLDEGRFEEWSALFTAQCLYWVPMAFGGGNPARQATLAFDDRRRLEDRIYWLRTGLVWGQIPPSRTSRMISNIDAAQAAEKSDVWVRSNFSLAEYRAGRQRVFHGRYRHTLRREAGKLKIAAKRVELIDAEGAHENLTIVF
jgi:3-phenylpropionate/cinnamic acid dioxygenase small subunit